MDTAELFIDPLPGRKPGQKKGRKGGLPWHIVRNINEADFDVLEQTVLNMDTGKREVVRIMRPKGAHFWCQHCERYYVDTFMKHYRETSLGPEEVCCAACYSELGIKNARPEPTTAIRPPTYAQRKASSTEEMEAIIIEYIEATKDQCAAYLQDFLAEFREVRHGHPLLEIMFTKSGQFMPDKADEEWKLYVDYS